VGIYILMHVYSVVEWCLGVRTVVFCSVVGLLHLGWLGLVMRYGCPDVRCVYREKESCLFICLDIRWSVSFVRRVVSVICRKSHCI